MDGAIMHTRYPHGVADVYSQTRDLLIGIALLNKKRFLFRSSGYINESAIAAGLGVRPSTVHRILHLEREPAFRDYHPSGDLLRGIVNLTSAKDLAEAYDAILNAEPWSEEQVRSLIPAPNRRSAARSSR